MIQNEVQKVLQNKYTNNHFEKLKILEVLYLANNLLEKYCIKETEITLGNHNDALGMCYNNGEQISLQLAHVIYGNLEEIKNTILHEIAHSLVGNENGHNEIWQTKAKEMGVTFDINYRK